MTRSAKGFCQGALGAAEDLLEPESGDGLSDKGAEDAVSVAVKETQGRVKRKGVKKLPPCPLRGGMLGDVDVADAAAAVIQDNEAVEDSEGGGGDGEEVDSGRCTEVVGKERAPSLRGRASRTDRHIPGDGGLGDGESQLQQLTVDPRRAPPRVGASHVANEAAEVRVLLGASKRHTRLPAPKETKALAVPADDCLGLDDEEDAAPTRPGLGEAGPEGSVDR